MRSQEVTVNDTELKRLLKDKDPYFWCCLELRTKQATSFEDLIFLSNLRKKAKKIGPAQEKQSKSKIKLALIGGYTFYPLYEFAEHILYLAGLECELFIGDFDNYISEILDENSALYQFRPDVVFLWPSEKRCAFQGKLTDDRKAQYDQVIRISEDILELCRLLNKRLGAEIVLSNFILPEHFDLGPYRTKTLGSPWNFLKMINLELGLKSPSYVHVCDNEFISCRRGLLRSRDFRAWLESRQPCSAEILVDVARELAHIICSLHGSPKKVIVLDLDNTLWGGVIGDDGLEGIELGDTSPRGEAFKEFQKYLLSLTERGLLLAVCSKNNREMAEEPFIKHPEMVLKLEHFVSFKANWKPKPDNIVEIAKELSLGLDSFVFVDDNPAEIEIVKQSVPQVTTILLGQDPADFIALLKDSRLFEPVSITEEDMERTRQYKAEDKRRDLKSSVVDMDVFLESLEMKAIISEFTPLDIPRIAQLINRSNQFNLTTRRRTEAGVKELIGRDDYITFTVRLSDKFGDHGLISVVIGEKKGEIMAIDTWLMSCRVLERQVEEEVINEIIRLARLKRCEKVLGIYLPTAKNGMVRDLYPRMGFELLQESGERLEFVRYLLDYREKKTRIGIIRRAYE